MYHDGLVWWHVLYTSLLSYFVFLATRHVRSLRKLWILMMKLSFPPSSLRKLWIGGCLIVSKIIGSKQRKLISLRIFGKRLLANTCNIEVDPKMEVERAVKLAFDLQSPNVTQVAAASLHVPRMSVVYYYLLRHVLCKPSRRHPGRRNSETIGEVCG